MVKDSVCIGAIRELFFDLRPVAVGSQDELWQGLSIFIFKAYLYSYSNNIYYPNTTLKEPAFNCLFVHKGSVLPQYSYWITPVLLLKYSSTPYWITPVLLLDYSSTPIELLQYSY